MCGTRDEEGYIDFKCPHCGFLVSFPATNVLTVQGCPNCLESVVVPQPGTEHGGKLPIPVRTPRLNLRRLNPEDRQDLRELMSDADSFRYIDWRPLVEEEVDSWLETEKTTRFSCA